MTAMIDGVQTSFQYIRASHDIDGFKVIANTAKDSIFFLLGYMNAEGSYLWERDLLTSDWHEDTLAFYNDMCAIAGVGGLIITTYDKELQRILGTFHFVVVDSTNISKLDTIIISDGLFDLFWTIH